MTFFVTNHGSLAHSFEIDKVATPALPHGKSASISVVLPRAGRYRFSSSLAGQAQIGMEGVLSAAKKAVEAEPFETKSRLGLVPFASGLGPLTDVVAPPGDPDRLLAVQQDGLVVLFVDGERADQPFLDLRRVVVANGEKGLLSIAFAPDYATSGLLYAYFNNRNGDVRVIEFHRSASNPNTVDTSTRRRILAITKPTADHNGGEMQFGPDGDLYIAVGDGGAAPPTIPVGIDGQTLGDLFGSILRIDPRSGSPYAIPAGNPFVGTPNARPEIVAYGLRNPWRFSIDSATNTMLIGDVGQDVQEEIDKLPLNQLGRNFGWPCREGSVVPPAVTIPASCAGAKLTAPIYDYPHGPHRCSIIGGVVDRDGATRALNGLFLWSDLCDGHVYAINPAAAKPTIVPLNLQVQSPTSFGVDGQSHVYLATETGTIYRLSIQPLAR